MPAIRLNYFRYADPTEPYAYVQTYPQGLLPVWLLERATERDPSLRDATIQVVMGLLWPLPWLLADYHHVGHWSKDRLPPGDAEVLFVYQDHRAVVEARLHRPIGARSLSSSARPYAQAYAYFMLRLLLAGQAAGLANVPRFTPRS